MNMKELYEQVRESNPLVFIGKEKLNESVINHVNEMLKKKKIIKLKFQKSVKDKDEMYEIIMELSLKTKSFCLDHRGRAFILSKKLISGVHQPKKFDKELYLKMKEEGNKIEIDNVDELTKSRKNENSVEDINENTN